MSEAPKRVPLRARLLVDIPANRFSLLTPANRPPTAGDIVQLDQGFTASTGEAMGLAYFEDESGTVIYEVEVADAELGPLLD